MLQSRRGVDEAAVEEHPASSGGRGFEIGDRHCDRPAGEGRKVDPRKRRPAARQLALHDAPPRLGDGVVAAGGEGGEQARLAATRAA
jgi:hypothetical protein